MALSPNLNVKKVRKTISMQIKQEMVEKNEKGCRDKWSCY
jgi:predicted transcriptional regulator